MAPSQLLIRTARQVPRVYDLREDGYKFSSAGLGARFGCGLDARTQQWLSVLEHFADVHLVNRVVSGRNTFKGLGYDLL